MSGQRTRAQQLMIAIGSERLGVQQMERTVITYLEAERKIEAEVWREALDAMVEDADRYATATDRTFLERIEVYVQEIRNRG